MDTEESAAEAIITERLVVFRSIEELQEQNATLRRSLRSLTVKMESIETDMATKKEEEVGKEMDEAIKVIEALQEQLRLQNLKIESFVRER